MAASRLALAAVVSLRAVLVYGEATSCAATELTWAELLPGAARRRAARVQTAARAHAAAGRTAPGVIRPAPSS